MVNGWPLGLSYLRNPGAEPEWEEMGIWRQIASSPLDR